MILTEYLSKHNLSYAAFGRDIGVKGPTVRRYCLGERIPNDPIMQRIFAATQGMVDANSFYNLKPDINHNGEQKST